MYTHSLNVVELPHKKVLVLSLVLISCGFIKETFGEREPTIMRDINCCSSKNSTDCVKCDSSSGYCCTNQPSTWENDNFSPYCCSIGSVCCGDGNCCSQHQVCCYSSDHSGTCCDPNHCRSDGTCTSTTHHGSNLLYIILGCVGLVGIPMIIFLCCRARRSRSSNQNILQSSSSQRALLINDDDNNDNDDIYQYGQPQYAGLYDGLDPFNTNNQFNGVPPHLLDRFPIMIWQDENPSPVVMRKNKSSESIEPLLAHTDSEYSEYMCSICLDNYSKDEKLRLLSCGHVFHADCIDLWFKKNTTCPLCKTELLPFLYE